MTPREWCLLEDGHAEEQKQSQRRIGLWICAALSAQGGEAGLLMQLLGEEKGGDNQTASEAKLREVEQKFAQMMGAAPPVKRKVR